MSLDKFPLVDLFGEQSLPPKKLLRRVAGDNVKKQGRSALKTTVRCSKEVADKVRGAREEIVRKGGLPSNYHVCSSINDLGQIAREITIHKRLDWDTETSGLRPWKDSLYCVSIYVNGQAYLINFEHPLLPQISRETFKSQLGEFFADDTVVKGGFNVKFDGHFLEEQAGVKMGYMHHDAGQALWLTHENIMSVKGRNRLKPLCERFLGISGASYDDAFGLQAWITIDPLVASFYALKDAELHYKLNTFAGGLLDEAPTLRRLYDNLEMPALNHYFETERVGLPVDVDFLPELDIKLSAEIEKLRNEMDRLSLSVLKPPALAPNWGSDEEVAHYLFDTLELRQVKQRSTDKAVLDILKDRNPIIPLLQRYRTQTKLKSAFIDSLPQFIVDGWVHPSFKPTGSTTGRSACSDPNMLQIPAKGEGAIIRQMFISPPGFFMVSKDYSGQELCIQASMTGDVALIKLISDGGDFYSEAAAIFYGGTAADYTKYGEKAKFRNKAKGAILAMSYGAGGAKVAEVFGCDVRKAYDFIENFFKKFPGLKKWQKRQVELAKAHGFVETILGRRRHLDYSNPNLEKFQIAEMDRFCINSPIQGSASDQIKLAMILGARHFKAKGYKSRVLFPIHDEVLYLINEDEFYNTNIMQEIDHIMINAVALKVPLTISTEIYSSWGKKVKFPSDDSDTDIAPAA